MRILFHESLIKLAACAVVIFIIYNSTVYMPHTNACNRYFVVSNFVSADELVIREMCKSYHTGCL